MLLTYVSCFGEPFMVKSRGGDILWSILRHVVRIDRCLSPFAPVIHALVST